MKGLTPQTEKIFEKISKLDCIQGYVMIGGTALSLQIDKRLSEDLDFCKCTSSPGKDKPLVNRMLIEQELNDKIGKVTKVDVLGFNQVNFVVEDVEGVERSRQLTIYKYRKTKCYPGLTNKKPAS
jgi:hypothetical protein